MKTTRAPMWAATMILSAMLTLLIHALAGPCFIDISHETDIRVELAYKEAGLQCAFGCGGVKAQQACALQPFFPRRGKDMQISHASELCANRFNRRPETLLVGEWRETHL
jgi:hypothetical protein